MLARFNKQLETQLAQRKTEDETIQELHSIVLLAHPLLPPSITNLVDYRCVVICEDDLNFQRALVIRNEACLY